LHKPVLLKRVIIKVKFDNLVVLTTMMLKMKPNSSPAI